MSSKPWSRLLVASLMLFASLAQAEGEGETLYRQHCARCHGDDGQARTWRGYLFFAKNLSKASWQARESDEDILDAIRNGPRAMPAFADKLNESEQRTLVHYVRALSRP